MRPCIVLVLLLLSYACYTTTGAPYKPIQWDSPLDFQSYQGSGLYEPEDVARAWNQRGYRQNQIWTDAPPQDLDTTLDDTVAEEMKKELVEGEDDQDNSVAIFFVQQDHVEAPNNAGVDPINLQTTKLAFVLGDKSLFDMENENGAEEDNAEDEDETDVFRMLFGPSVIDNYIEEKNEVNEEGYVMEW